MGYLKLLLKYLGLYIIMATDMVLCNLDSELTPHLPNNTLPFHYNIFLTPNLKKRNSTFHGESNIHIKIHNASLNINLYSKELKINETATTLITVEGTVYKPMEHSYDNKTDILTLNFENALLPGFYILNMKFTGNIPRINSVKKGFMIFPYTNKGKNSTLAATHFEPRAARQMFPCWDEPALKATFNISVMHHKKYSVLSNMPIIRQQIFEYDMMWTHFNTSVLMSTYLVTIIVIPTSEYVSVSNARGTINVWCRSSIKSQVTFVQNITEKIMPILIEYVNSSERVPKMDHVMIPNFPVDGMEQWGLISYNELSVAYNDSKYPTYKKAEVATIVTHELVHQWFGNLVTPSWWSYLWLKEGLATFLTTHILNKTFEDWRMMDSFVIQTLQNCLIIDRIGILNSVTLQPGSSFESLEELYSIEVYGKAPALMRMLSNIITDEVFRKGLIMYLTKHEYGSTIPDDLWSALQSALDESNVPHKNYRIKEVMDTWMNQASYPEVHVMRNYETDEVIISQRCNSECDNKWWIPISFATQSNPDFSNTVPRYWLRPDQNISFVINRNDWIIVNVQQTGYYRVNYDIENWEKISYYLNSEAYTNIHVLNRAQIIDDLFEFVMTGRLNGSFFLNHIRYLYQEIDYVAWYPFLFRVIPLLKNYLFLPEAIRVKVTIMKFLGELLRNTGYLENFNDDHITKLTRLNAIKWACNLDITFCKHTTAIKLSQHLAHPKLHKFLPGHNLMYCTGLMTADRTIWNKMLELYQKTDPKKEKFKNTLLDSLSCAENSDIIINYLNITAFNTSLFPEKDHSRAFTSILEKHSRKILILDYILNNFKIIKPKSLTTITMIKLILQNTLSYTEIDKIKRFSDVNFDHDTETRIAIEELIKENENKYRDNLDFFKTRFS